MKQIIKSPSVCFFFHFWPRELCAVAHLPISPKVFFNSMVYKAFEHEYFSNKHVLVMMSQNANMINVHYLVFQNFHCCFWSWNSSTIDLQILEKKKSKSHKEFEKNIMKSKFEQSEIKLNKNIKIWKQGCHRNAKSCDQTIDVPKSSVNDF